jgi:hypothetical protein
VLARTSMDNILRCDKEELFKPADGPSDTLSAMIHDLTYVCICEQLSKLAAKGRCFALCAA